MASSGLPLNREQTISQIADLFRHVQERLDQAEEET